jgi:hypothetical protein
MFRFRIADVGLRIVSGTPQSGASPACCGPQSSSVFLWGISGAVSAIVVGWIAARVHASGHAPWGLTSIAIGALLGAALVFLAVRLGVPKLYVLVIGAVLFSICTIVAEHAWLYREFCRQWRDERRTNAAVAMFRDENPPPANEYFRRELNVGLWSTDAALITAAAVAVVVLGRRQACSFDPASNAQPPAAPTPDT